MSKLVGVELSGAAIFAAKKITKVQAAGGSALGPAERVAKITGEILEVELIRRFEAMFGMSVGAYLEQKHQRDASGHTVRPCRVPASLSQPDGYADDATNGAD